MQLYTVVFDQITIIPTLYTSHWVEIIEGYVQLETESSTLTSNSIYKYTELFVFHFQ